MIHLQLPSGDTYKVTANETVAEQKLLIAEGKERHCISSPSGKFNFRILTREEIESSRNSAYKYFERKSPNLTRRQQ